MRSSCNEAQWEEVLFEPRVQDSCCRGTDRWSMSGMRWKFEGYLFKKDRKAIRGLFKLSKMQKIISFTTEREPRLSGREMRVRCSLDCYGKEEGGCVHRSQAYSLISLSYKYRHQESPVSAPSLVF